MIRNITFMEAEGVDSPDQETPEEVILRTRKVTVSPQEEYQLRAGEVRPISNELAAAILSFKGRAQIGNKGVLVDRKDIGGRFVYFHEDSIIINDFSCRERKFFYVINRVSPDILHLLDDTGVYVESLPLRERPAVLDNDAQAREISRHKTVISRAASRLQNLHADDTRDALETLAANSCEMQRVVQTLPAPAAQPVQPARSIQGEAAAAGGARINAIRANKASAVAMGRAVSLNRRHVTPAEPQGEVENWSSNSRYHAAPDGNDEDWTFSPNTQPQTQPQTTVEKW